MLCKRVGITDTQINKKGKSSGEEGEILSQVYTRENPEIESDKYGCAAVFPGLNHHRKKKLHGGKAGTSRCRICPGLQTWNGDDLFAKN